MLNFGIGKFVSKVRLDGKIAIITGSNTGIGKITAKEFYRIGAKVIMACRDIKKAENAIHDIKETAEPIDNQPLGELIIRELDLTSLKSVRECAKEILLTEERINILVNNAGIMMCPKGKTKDGFETHFGVNHLGHFLFTCLLLPRIKHSTPARIINVSSVGHKLGSIHFDDINLDKYYAPITAYNQSKLANLLFSLELAQRLGDKEVNVYTVHPGLVRTELGRHLRKSFLPGVSPLIRLIMYPFQKNPEQGAQTTIYCATDEGLINETGYYYSECQKRRPSANALKTEDAKKLWDLSMKFAGLENWDPFTAPQDQLPPILQNI